MIHCHTAYPSYQLKSIYVTADYGTYLIPNMETNILHRDGILIQVREEYPICVQSQNTTEHKTKFITLLQHYNNMFRPKLSAIVRLYMKPIVCMP